MKILNIILSIIVATNMIISMPLNISESNNYYNINETIDCIYYDSIEFQKSILNAKYEEIDGEIWGGVVPHHLLVDNMIADFFKTISKQTIDTIVIIGPNHKAIGSMVQTSNLDWNTEYGVLENDKDSINKLLRTNTVNINNELAKEEHSISSLIPYVKYYFNDSKVVPIYITNGYSLQSNLELAKNIKNILQNKRYLVIASVDFSHYLTKEEADLKDRFTIDSIKRRDLNELSFMNSDYLDSPQSIIALLNIMNEENIFSEKIIEHNNSDNVIPAKINETTSYFTIVYYK